MSINCLLPLSFSQVLYASCALVIFCLAAESFGQDEETSDPAAKFSEIRKLIDADESAKAVSLLDELIESDPNLAIARYVRGREHFKLNKVEKSVTDFDKYVELKPAQSASQWERGISLFYAGKFSEGAKQFENYQTYHDSDVENSVWRFLCVARAKNLEAARMNMLEIKGDTRVPMMKIYAMYRGDCEPEDVIAEAKAGDPSEAELNQRMFYATLYVGLYEEVRENHEEAEKQLRQAVKHKIDHYMWNVANVHVKRYYESPDTRQK